VIVATYDVTHEVTVQAHVSYAAKVKRAWNGERLTVFCCLLSIVLPVLTAHLAAWGVAGELAAWFIGVGALAVFLRGPLRHSGADAMHRISGG
jgi:hypothetical protein